jgi:sterol desaturase/sphingolipid hydroxylase (fatty acid hydroxylase superfamily)
LEDIIGPLFPLSFVLALVLERLLQTARQPLVPGWRAKGIAFFVVGAAVNALAPSLLTAPLEYVRLLDLSRLSTFAGASVVVLVSSLADYWLHRAMHQSNTLFRWAHQMHHSAERVDMAGFAYSHPFELLLSVLLATFVGALLGVPEDAALVGGFTWYAAQLFLHMDIDTPRWIGWLRVHHTRGVHAYNYGLPLWDAAFGTLRNPEHWDRTYGFWDGASRRVMPMLAGRDVSTQEASAGR